MDDKERYETLRDFYEVYCQCQNNLKKQGRVLRMEAHFDHEGSAIKIYEVHGADKDMVVCIKTDDEATCYRQATARLKERQKKENVTNDAMRICV